MKKNVQPKTKAVKKVDYPTAMPKKMSIICSKAGTTNPDKVQKY